MSNAASVSPILSAARLTSPALSAPAERTLTAALVRAHAMAWFVVLGPECVRDTRRAAVLRQAARAAEVDVEPFLGAMGEASALAIDDVPALAARCRAGLDHDQDLLRAAQAVVLDECDDVRTSPRASARSVARAERWRRHVLQAALELSRLEDRMVRHNLGLAVLAANARRGSGVPMDDLVQQGALGVLAAVRRFDPSRGLKFSTMASWWVKHYVGRYIENCSRTIRLPVWACNLLTRVRAAERALYSLERGPATAEEVAASLGADPERVALLMRADLSTASLDAPVVSSRLRGSTASGDGSPASSLMDLQADDRPTVEQDILARQRREMVGAALRTLPAHLVRPAIAVHLDGEDPKVVAERYGLCPNAMRGAVVEAMREMSAPMLRACL